MDASGVQRTRGYRFELKVNNKERTRLQQCAGTAGLPGIGGWRTGILVTKIIPVKSGLPMR
ncbi:MAG: hypothetical protein ACXACI_06080 [Candidatus Hodarchaeales archaeon]